MALVSLRRGRFEQAFELSSACDERARSAPAFAGRGSRWQAEPHRIALAAEQFDECRRCQHREFQLAHQFPVQGHPVQAMDVELSMTNWLGRLVLPHNA